MREPASKCGFNSKLSSKINGHLVDGFIIDTNCEYSYDLSEGNENIIISGENGWFDMHAHNFQTSIISFHRPYS